MKQLILFLAKYGGIFALCRWITRKDLRILAYHGIWMGEGHFGNFLYMSPEKFARRMQKLKSLNVPVLALDEALQRKEMGSLPDNAVVITIDDGWYSSYRHMLPELEKRAFPATLYLTTYYSEHQFPVFAVLLEYMFDKTSADCIDLTKLGISERGKVSIFEAGDRDEVKSLIQSYANDLTEENDRQSLVIRIGQVLGINCEYLIKNKIFHLVSLEQIEDINRRGFDIQLHTHRHRVFHRGTDCLDKELKDNRACLGRIIEKPIQHFCYPSGVYDESFWPTLDASKICSATTTEVGLVCKDSQQYALPRILDGEKISDLEFEAELWGFLEVKRRIFGTLGFCCIRHSKSGVICR